MKKMLSFGLMVLMAMVAGAQGLAYHSADVNHDHQIGLSELLRVIQLFNGIRLHCEAGTEDGYGLGGGNQNCSPHSADYQPQDWKIELTELLRVIQIYNSGLYRSCETGELNEDSFCLGLPPLEIRLPFDGRGLSLDVVRGTLIREDFTPRVIGSQYSVLAEGFVTDQQPVGYPVPVLSVIDLTVSAGPAPIVPSIAVGQTLSEVTATLAAVSADLVPCDPAVAENNDTVPMGGFLRSNPPAGQPITFGQCVTIVLSAGPAVSEGEGEGEGSNEGEGEGESPVPLVVEWSNQALAEQDLHLGETKDIYAITVGATTGSHTLDRVDVHFSERPWLSLSKVELHDSVEGVVASKSISSAADAIEVVIDSDYVVRLENFSYVVEHGVSRILVLSATGGIDSYPIVGQEMAITLPSGSIRAEDGNHLPEFVGIPGTYARSVTVPTTITVTGGHVNVVTLVPNSEFNIYFADTSDTTFTINDYVNIEVRIGNWGTPPYIVKVRDGGGTGLQVIENGPGSYVVGLQLLSAGVGPITAQVTDSAGLKLTAATQDITVEGPGVGK